MLCYFAMILFVTDDLIVDVSIIFAIRRALRGCSIVPIVLVETLNGINIVSADKGELFRVAPILLYMLLLEKFWFISTNQISLSILHNMSLFFRHPITSGFTWSSVGWTSRRPLGTLGGTCMVVVDINVMSTRWQNYLRIQGLHQTSFYIPSRLLHQFNIPQSVAHFAWTSLPSLSRQMFILLTNWLRCGRIGLPILMAVQSLGSFIRC